MKHEAGFYRRTEEGGADGTQRPFIIHNLIPRPPAVGEEPEVPTTAVLADHEQLGPCGDGREAILKHPEAGHDPDRLQPRLAEVASLPEAAAVEVHLMRPSGCSHNVVWDCLRLVMRSKPSVLFITCAARKFSPQPFTERLLCVVDRRE